MAEPGRQQIAIRDVGAKDLEAASRLLDETWHHTYDGLYGKAKVSQINADKHSAAALGTRLGQSDAAFLVAEQAGLIIGLAYARLEAGTLDLHQLYVSPAVQGTGIGSALFEAVLTRLPGFDRVRLEVDPQNAGAIAFYKRAGFAPVGKTEACAGIDGIAAIIMERVETGG